MNLRKYHVPFTVLALSVVVVAALLAYASLSDGDSDATPELLFPTGIPPVFGTTSTDNGGEYGLNTISVTGSGAASMQANEASVTLGGQTEDESASDAVRLNADLMTAVIDAMKRLGIAEEDMKTVSYSVYPMYGYDYNSVVGYRVVNMIAVKLTEMGLIGEVIDAAVRSGANRIQGVSFGLSEASREALRRQAYVAALGSAEEKAELIAERLGLSISGVLSVSESSYQPYQPYRNYFDLYGEAASSTPIIEGQLSVSVTLHVIYYFEQ